MSGPAPPLTTGRRLVPGPAMRTGTAAAYRALQIIDGEPHILRGLGAPAAAARVPGRPLLCLAHLTDFQLADVQSPGRFEFLNGLAQDPRYAWAFPMHRPQEALVPRAVDAMVRTINDVRGPATGLAPALAVTTGDAIDNAQWNEMQAVLALLDGGLVRPDSGGPRYEGVQSLDWPSGIFWKTGGCGPAGPDLFRREYGFPHCPGLLQRALGEFRAGGLRIPWLACFGNHEALSQGVGTVTAAVSAALTGAAKPVRLAGLT